MASGQKITDIWRRFLNLRITSFWNFKVAQFFKKYDFSKKNQEFQPNRSDFYGKLEFSEEWVYRNPI